MEDKYTIRRNIDGLYVTVKEVSGGYEVDIFKNGPQDSVTEEELLELIPKLKYADS